MAKRLSLGAVYNANGDVDDQAIKTAIAWLMLSEGFLGTISPKYKHKEVELVWMVPEVGNLKVKAIDFQAKYHYISQRYTFHVSNNGLVVTLPWVHTFGASQFISYSINSPSVTQAFNVYSSSPTPLPKTREIAPVVNKHVNPIIIESTKPVRERDNSKMLPAPKQLPAPMSRDSKKAMQTTQIMDKASLMEQIANFFTKKAK